MAALRDAAGGIPILEDAAQAIGASCDGKPVGGLAWAGCFSFYPTKNLGGFGDGGMVTTDDGELAERMRVLCDHGQQPRYHHSIVGLNSRLDSIQAAVLGVKLERLDDYAAARRRHAERYEAAFTQGAALGVIDTPREAHGCPSVLEPGTRSGCSAGVATRCRPGSRSGKSEQRFIIRFRCTFRIASRGLDYEPGDLPETERACEEVLSLPVFPEMTAAEQERVIESVNSFAESLRVERAPSRRLAA